MCVYPVVLYCVSLTPPWPGQHMAAASTSLGLSARQATLQHQQCPPWWCLQTCCLTIPAPGHALASPPAPLCCSRPRLTTSFAEACQFTGTYEHTQEFIYMIIRCKKNGWAWSCFLGSVLGNPSSCYSQCCHVTLRTEQCRGRCRGRNQCRGPDRPWRELCGASCVY
jgi:hypothetical protein